MLGEPAWGGYFADPFLVRLDDGWIAYGSAAPFTTAGGSVQAIVSPDLRSWRSIGTVYTCDPSVGTDVWAPEVVQADGAWWLYCSVGRGIDGHHLRVARADSPAGPFIDCGIDLTPDESFAIDAHPFLDADGSRYLFYAHDVLDAPRPGTHLAVRRMTSSTSLDAAVVPVLAPAADWQLYAAQRSMYGRRLDWYTLEGPTVVRRGPGEYVLLYSGGSWEGSGYGVSYATAEHPTGPWSHPLSDVPLVLSGPITGLVGPGHNSVASREDGSTVTAFHAWDPTGERRRMHLAALRWEGLLPSVAPLADGAGVD